MNTAQQLAQAEEYSFPYHYIPRIRGGDYSFARYWNFSASYLAAVNLVHEWLKQRCARGRSNWRHIDVGCGDGGFLYLLNDLFKDSRPIEFSGIDFDANAISFARAFNPDVHFVCGDVAAVTEQFDSGTLVEVIEHIEPDHLPDFIRNVHRLIADDGVLFVTVPHRNKPLEAKHFQHFTFDSLQRCFEPWFRVEEIGGFERRSLLYRVFNRILFNRYFVASIPAINQFMVRQLERTWPHEHGVGRIYLALRKL